MAKSMAKLGKRFLCLSLGAISLSTLSVACTPIDDMPPPPASGGVEMPAGVALEGTAWRLSRYNDQAILPDTEVTVEFAGGQLNGNGGCNGYFADYTLAEASLSVGPVGSTKIACSVPAGLMAQEMAYFELLSQAESVAIEGNILTLTTPAGDLIFSAQAAGAAE